jgi:hypothetical protein
MIAVVASANIWDECDSGLYKNLSILSLKIFAGNDIFFVTKNHFELSGALVKRGVILPSY